MTEKLLTGSLSRNTNKQILLFKNKTVFGSKTKAMVCLNIMNEPKGRGSLTNGVFFSLFFENHKSSGHMGM